MKIENRQQFLVMLTIAMVALLVVVNFILTPLGGWWSSRQAQIKKLRAEVADGRRLVQRESGIRNHWSEMQTNALPASTSLAEQQLLKAVNTWSQDSGATLTSLTPQWNNDSTNYLTLACHVETAGNLGQLSRFLYSLEKGPMALRLNTVELAAHDKDGQQMTLSVDLNGLALISPNTQ